MSGSSLPRRRRFRRGTAVLLIAAAPLSMAGACEQEGAEVPGVEQGDGEDEGEDDD